MSDPNNPQRPAAGQRPPAAMPRGRAPGQPQPGQPQPGQPQGQPPGYGQRGSRQQPGMGQQPRYGQPVQPQPVQGQPGYGEPHRQAGLDGPPWGEVGPYDEPPQSGNRRKVLLLAVGGLILVAILGTGIALLGRSHDGSTTQPAAKPAPQIQPKREQPKVPGEKPTVEPPNGGLDAGIEVGEGVFIKPAAGYVRQQADSGLVVLVKGTGATGAGFIRAEVIKDPSKIPTVLLPAIAKDAKGLLNLSDFSIREGVQVLHPKNRKLAYMGSIPWSGTASMASKKLALEGYTTVIERKDHVFSMITFFCPKDLESQERPNRDLMLESVVNSQ